jgi:hypothetical protein
VIPNPNYRRVERQSCHMEERNWTARTKTDLIIEVWEALDCESVGVRELETIQRMVCARFGEAAVDSPATIARLLAEEGAVLRHPEVLDCDTKWRAHMLENAFAETDFSSLTAAAASMTKLHSWRKTLQDDQVQVRLLHEFVADVRADLLFVAVSETSGQRGKEEAREIGQWLSVWSQTPELFPDWLELRLGSSGFRSLFPDFEIPQ